MTRTTRPVALSLEAAWVSFSKRVVMLSVVRSGRREGIGSADDLADFLGDLGLAGLVGKSGVGTDQLGGVVAGRLHRAPACRRLRGGGLEQRREDPRADVTRQQRADEL